MQNNLYPVDHVQDSIEGLIIEHSRKSHAVYLALLVAILTAIVVLPLVRVNVTRQADGIIRPITEKHEVTASAAGFAESLQVREGSTVKKGQVLLRLRATPLDERGSVISSRITEARRSIADLELLTRGGAVAMGRFQSPRWAQAYSQLAAELRDNDARAQKASMELERVRALASRQLVPQTEVEDKQFQLAQVRTDRTLLVQRSRSEWEAALVSSRMELKELLSQQGQLQAERNLYTVTSPVDGTVEQLASVSSGSYVQAGQKLVVISPSSDVVAEVYVSPRDIGLLRQGNPVRMQVDAFNYNDWGFVTGRATEIADDFVMINDVPVFRVRIAMDQTHLQLKNGVRGRLKKGMTLRARFEVAERSLWQLLRDDVNDWLNPAQSDKA